VLAFRLSQLLRSASYAAFWYGHICGGGPEEPRTSEMAVEALFRWLLRLSAADNSPGAEISVSEGRMVAEAVLVHLVEVRRWRAVAAIPRALAVTGALKQRY
jgi:hypothetical protein